MSVSFTVNTDGLTATVDELTPIVDAVNSYFTSPARGIAAPVPVFQGDWETFRHDNQGPPGYVVIGRGNFQFVGSAVRGVRWAPGTGIPLDDTHEAPVVGARLQTLNVWTRAIPPGNWETQEPGSAFAIAQTVAAYKLADLTWSALRDAHGHDLDPAAGKPLDPDRGEAGYGVVLAWSFGPIPVPVLGDVVPLTQPTGVSATIQAVINGTPATPGDTVTAP